MAARKESTFLFFCLALAACLFSFSAAAALGSTMRSMALSLFLAVRTAETRALSALRALVKAECPAWDWRSSIASATSARVAPLISSSGTLAVEAAVVERRKRRRADGTT